MNRECAYVVGGQQQQQQQRHHHRPQEKTQPRGVAEELHHGAGPQAGCIECEI